MGMGAWAAPTEGGVRFKCAEAQQADFDKELQQFLGALGVKASWVEKSAECGAVTYRLGPELSRITAVEMYHAPVFELRNEIIRLPTTEPGKTRDVQTVSKKEIAVSLLHPGRTTEAPCDIEAFKDHIGLRQNIVAWTERLSWNWPDGTPAEWNKDYWNRGTPTGDTVAAFNDAFVRQEAYAIGCYTASKLAVSQGILDYYNRVNPNPARLKEVLSYLHLDDDPLIRVEPEAMWVEFESDPKAAAALEKEGKLLKMLPVVAQENFVPGDWAYMRNTDKATQDKTGYEGSNAIYLGRGRFDDFYNDHYYSYTYLEKLDEVYQWRNEVFSRSRDMGKVMPMTLEETRRLGTTPEQGGLVMAYRVVPYFFGHEGPSNKGKLAQKQPD